jgi:hypothetical protein
VRVSLADNLKNPSHAPGANANIKPVASKPPSPSGVVSGSSSTSTSAAATAASPAAIENNEQNDDQQNLSSCELKEFNILEDKKLTANSRYVCDEPGDGCFGGTHYFKKPVTVFGQKTGQLYTFSEGGHFTFSYFFQNNNQADTKKIMQQLASTLKLPPDKKNGGFSRETKSGELSITLHKKGKGFFVECSG